MGGGDKQMAYVPAAMGEKGKSKEQLAEEKRVALAVRVAPLVGLEEMSQGALQEKAGEFWKRIVKLETEKYDLEMRMNRQDYDIRELKERQKQQLRQKAIKKGLDPEALTGKHPPKIQTASKFERRADSRSAFLNGSVSAQARRRVNPIPKVRRKKKRKKKRRRKKSRFSTES